MIIIIITIIPIIIISENIYCQSVKTLQRLKSKPAIPEFQTFKTEMMQTDPPIERVTTIYPT